MNKLDMPSYADAFSAHNTPPTPTTMDNHNATDSNILASHYLGYVINYYNIESYAKANRLPLEEARLFIKKAQTAFEALKD